MREPREWKRRILSLLLAVVMTVGNLPVSALAEGQEVVEYSESTTLADYMEPSVVEEEPPRRRIHTAADVVLGLQQRNPRGGQCSGRRLR